MANKKWIEHHFSKALRDQRDRRHLSQDQLAKMLADKDVHMHWTTIAKIEKGERSVRIDEAAAIADLFGMSVDTLLGRKQEPRRDLHYALGALLDTVYMSQTQLHRTAKSLDERLEDIPSGFEGYDTLARLEREVSGQLDKAQKALDRLKNKLDDELIAAVESRAAKRLKEMSNQELEQLEKSIPPADKEP